MNHRASVTVIAVGIVPLVALARPQDQGLVFRAGTDLVTVDVNVQRGHKPVTGLGPSDFEIYDNGQRQTVTELSYGRLPIDLRLVFDTSGSIDDDSLEAYVRAMGQITSDLRPQDRCEIVTCSARIRDAASLQAPPVHIEFRRAGPETTSFFDAIGLALITTPVLGRRQLTVVMSDADDNASFFDEAAMNQIARRTDAVVYAVLPVKSWHATDDKREKTLSDRLAGLAALTGGRVIQPNHDLDIVPAFRAAIEEFRQSYVLAYTATNVEHGGWHELSVGVHTNKPCVVRARRGYVG